MKSEANSPKVLSSKVAYKNPFFSVTEELIGTRTGRKDIFYTVQKNDVAVIVPVDSDGNLLLVDMYRYTFKGTSIEFPAGNVDPGEEPLDTAKREIQEETGHVANTWKHLGSFQAAVGIANRQFHFYLATDLEKTDNHEMEEEDISQILKVSEEKFEDMVKNREIKELETIAAYQLYKLHK